MRSDALFKRYEFIVAAAALAAHASAGNDGFRQREMRFLIELFSNWISDSLGGEVLKLSNTQILRYLDELVREGYAKQVVRRRWPHYRLTRTGLIELLSRMVTVRAGVAPSQFFLIYYFVSNYRERLTELIQREGNLFPLALRLEVEELLNRDALVERQLRFIDRELQKLEGKIHDGLQSSRLATKLFALGTPHLEVVRHVEKLFPYGLNSQKPLTELLAEIPHDIGRWELETGGRKRAEEIFTPTKAVLSAYRAALERLRRR